MCMGVLLACMSVHHIYTVPVGTRKPGTGTGVADSYVPQCG